jgi:hypothetical protein
MAFQAYADDSKFSPTLWKADLNFKTDVDGKTKYVSRVNEFEKLLRDYDLIGMKRSNIIALLGDEDRHDGGYLIQSGSDDMSVLQIEFVNEQVKRFRLRGFSHSGKSIPWQDRNVLWTTSGGFVPKGK